METNTNHDNRLLKAWQLYAGINSTFLLVMMGILFSVGLIWQNDFPVQIPLPFWFIIMFFGRINILYWTFYLSYIHIAVALLFLVDAFFVYRKDRDKQFVKKFVIASAIVIVINAVYSGIYFLLM